jgi:hypothetical protein
LDIIKNERHHNNHFLTQGWFGLRNRGPIENDISNEERNRKEAEFFSQGIWVDVNPTRLGIGNLNAALTKMHNKHITNSIPELMPEIKARLAICEERLAQLSTPRGLKEGQLDCMVQLVTKFSRLSADALDGFYHKSPDKENAKLRKNVRSRLEKFMDEMHLVYFANLLQLDASILTSLDDNTWRQYILNIDSLQEIHQVIRSNRGREFADEINPNVKQVLWKGRTSKWETKASSLLEAVGLQIHETMKVLMEVATPEEELQNNNLKWLASHLPTATDSAIEVDKLLTDEEYLWTLVPTYKTIKETCTASSSKKWQGRR